MNPTVSIIIPVYNTAPYLEECINSVLEQSFREIEIILVDDGSSDGSEVLCDRFALQDDRVIVIHQDNQGVSHARNVGIKKSSSEWLMFLDADDYLELDAIEKSLQFTEPKEDIIILPFEGEISANQEVIRYDLNKYRTEFLGACRVNNPEYFPQEMRVGLRLTSQCAKLYRHSLLKQHGIEFPEDIKDNEDSIYNFKYIFHSRNALFINHPIYHVRERENSASRSNEGKGERIVRSLNAFNKLINDYNVQKELKDYQSIDGFLKEFQIVISCCKMHCKEGKAYWECFHVCKKYLNEDICRKLIKNTKISRVESIVNKAVVLCLKMRLYLMVFSLFDIYYSIK